MTKNELVPIPTKKHNGIISFWKFCFCMMVVIFHSYAFVANGEKTVFRQGYIAVEFFFLVSGFLLAKSALKKEESENWRDLGKETFQFVAKKYLAFLPYVLFGGIIALILQNILKHVGFYQNASSIWDLLLLRMTGLKGNAVIGQAWYISAMLLCMLVLYPLLRKYKYNFVYLAAPIIVLLGLGWISQTYSRINNPEVWTGFLYKGVIRAFIELTLGCILYVVCQKLKQVDFTKFGKLLITVIEIGGFIFPFLVAQFVSHTKFDFIILAVLSISVLLAFSEKTLEFRFMNNKVCFWLERFSLPLYLCHHIARNIVRDVGFINAMPYYTKLAIYLGITFIISLICMYLIPYLQNKHLFSKFKKLIIKEESLS